MGGTRARSRGYLRLRTAEPNGLLEIQPNFLTEQADVDALATGSRAGLEIASQSAYRDLILDRPAKANEQDTVTFIRRFCMSYLLRYLGDGVGRRSGGGRRAACARHREPAHYRRLDHANDPLGRHQRACGHDRWCGQKSLRTPENNRDALDKLDFLFAYEFKDRLVNFFDANNADILCSIVLDAFIALLKRASLHCSRMGVLSNF